MKIIADTRSRRLLIMAYALFSLSMLLPTLAIDLGTNGGPVQAGYRVFLGGPVAAFGIILEPGGKLSNLYLGIYFFVAWLANIALLLPAFVMIPRAVRLAIGSIFALLAWSILCCYLLIDLHLIREIGIGYYLWSASITLILFFLLANETVPARVGTGSR